MHTNFRLDDSGEYLALVAPDGVTVLTTSFNVTLSSEFEEETIRYTTDGSVPSASSPVYSGPITSLTGP